jgi:hypothetical protein
MRAKGIENIFRQTVRIVEMQSEAGAVGAVHSSLGMRIIPHVQSNNDLSVRGVLERIYHTYIQF